MDVLMVLLGISFIIFFGYVAEFIFKKFGIPDVLFLMALGFLLSRPELFGVNNPLSFNIDKLAEFAPVFTTFTLLFIVYQGAFSVDLSSFARGLKKGLVITSYNFVISAIVAFTVMFYFTGDPLLSLLTAFILCDVAQAFVIPVIEKLKVSPEAYSVLNLEGTFSDVFVTVFSMATLEITTLGTFNLGDTVSHLLAMISIAFFTGIVLALLWMAVLRRVFAGHGAYMLTVAYVILVYVFTEMVGGSGIIAILFFGLVLRNADQLKAIANYIQNPSRQNNASIAANTGGKFGGVIPANEVFFYSQISFLLTTFFFVYIGMVINVDDPVPILMGLLISVGLMASRASSYFLLSEFNPFDRNIIASLFPRGLAAAALAQAVVLSGLSNAAFVVNVVYSVIIFSIILSSINVFFTRRILSGG